MRVVVAALALLLVVAAACGQSQARPSNELVLGAIYPLSGPQAAGGSEHHDARDRQSPELGAHARISPRLPSW